MICNIKGKQYKFPDSELASTNIRGVALVPSGFVTEQDIANADRDALLEFQMLPLKMATRLRHLQLERSDSAFTKLLT